MNKQKRLVKRLIRQASISAAMVSVVGGFCYFTHSLLNGSETEKTTADRAFSKTQTQVNALKSQLDKSNTAERRFEETQGTRENVNYSANQNNLKDWIRTTIVRYRLSPNFKLSLTPDKLVENKELNGANYQAIEHPGMKFEFSAISDTHIFSFLDELKSAGPGFFLIESLSIKRTGDIDKTALTQLRAGNAPYLVDAKVSFNWIGIEEKPVSAEENASTASAPSKASPTPLPSRKAGR